MKKFVLFISVIILFFVLFLAFTNPSLGDFEQKVSSATLPKYNEWYMLRLYKNAEERQYGKTLYFQPTYSVEHTNYLLFSTYTIKAGWEGTMNISGLPVNKSKLLVSSDDAYRQELEYRAIGILGDFHLTKENERLNFKL